MIPAENYSNKLIMYVLDILKSEEFKKLVTSVGGYDISRMGATNFYK